MPFAALPAQQQMAIVNNVVGYSCLPWANVLHNGRNVNQSLEEKEWSGTLKAAYRWNDNVMTFASAARGYKGGGFNLDRTQDGITPTTADTSFPGEFVDSYELGAKTTWAGGTLLLNATVFSQEYTDFQLNSFLGTSYVVRSIPEVTSEGVELDVLWQTGLKGLMLQGGVTYANTRYGDDLLPDADLVLLPGNYISFAPKWSASASLTCA